MSKATSSPLDKAFAERVAVEWIGAWNAHDLARVLSHYSEDFEMSSPYVVEIAGDPSGTLRGKAAVGAYWKKALEHLLGVVTEARRPSRKALREEFILREDFRRWLRATKHALPAFWFARTDRQ